MTRTRSRYRTPHAHSTGRTRIQPGHDRGADPGDDGLALTMIGAVIVHARRGETTRATVPGILLILAAVVAVLRFGPYAF